MSSSKQASPLTVMQGCADETGWNDNSQLAVALNFIYARPELWAAFREHCLAQVAEESAESVEGA